MCPEIQLEKSRMLYLKNQILVISMAKVMHLEQNRRDFHTCGRIDTVIEILQILPEKFHGLTDTDVRYRQRYIDLIMNEESKNVFVKRSLMMKEIRNFLASRDFMEVETPMLVSNAGGANHKTI